MKAILDKPTVGEFIEYLKKYAHPEWPLRIEDADTSWEIHKIHLNFDNGKLWLSGEYVEMGPEDGPNA